MRELREVSEKYMASERARAELEQRYGGQSPQSFVWCGWWNMS